MVETNTVYTDPWEELLLRDSAKKRAFLEAYDSYNKELAHGLNRIPVADKPIVGRDREILDLFEVMQRPDTPVGILIGQAGVGKTALVKEFARQANSGLLSKTIKDRYLLVKLELGNLGSLVGTNELQGVLSTLLDRLGELQKLAKTALQDPNIKLTLFIDEVHMLVTIFGPGTKIGGDVIKTSLAEPPINVISATTRKEYDQSILTDAPFAERWKRIELQEVGRDVVKIITKKWWQTTCSKQRLDWLKDSLTDEIMDEIIDNNAAYQPDNAEPRKSIDILESVIARSKVKNEKPSLAMIRQIFVNRFNIATEFSVDPDDIFYELDKRIKGQPYALYIFRRAFRAMARTKRRKPNRPMSSFLLTGPTGVGKTESTKGIAHALYPNEKVLVHIDMQDYQTPESGKDFRQRVGEAIRHNPKAILLLDEIDKADKMVLDSLLAILDEGLLTYNIVNTAGASEPTTVSFRNSIVVCTTNAGAEIFKNDAEFRQSNVLEQEATVIKDASTLKTSDLSDSEVSSLLTSLETFLIANGFRPEFLGRFDRIVPFRGLSALAFVQIAQNKIDDMILDFEALDGITIKTNEPRQWPKDSWDCFATDLAVDIAYIRADAKNPNSGGARAIQKYVDMNLRDEIIDALYSYPEHTTFKLSIDENSKVYNPGASSSKKGAIVNAI